MIDAVYIHIPFCKNICSYCDFCKFYYNKKWADNFLKSLESEIKKNYKNEVIKTLYIGGGTPNSLDDKQLKELLKLLKIIKLDNDYEYTIECNIEFLTSNQIKLFKEFGINRISLGIQTFNEKYLNFLNRNHTKELVKEKINLLKENGFLNINVDLIYALPNQTLEELKEDIIFFKSLDIPHISTYSLIIEPHTVLYNNNVSNIDEDLDSDMYNLIIKELDNYNHYEISNFAKAGYESRHNLVYWNNLNYYGFGIGASGYIGNVRYDNTRSYNNYIEGNYRLNEEYLDKSKTIENEFILGFRKMKGINISDFYNKYKINIMDIDVVKRLLDKNLIVKDNDNIRLDSSMIYRSNEVLIEFLGEDYEK